MQKRGYHDFPSEIFCLTVPKKEDFVGEPFGVSEKFGYRKILCIRRGFHYFLLKIFSSRSAEKFRGGPFNVSENFGYRKVLCIRRGYHYFPSKIFCLTVPKKFVGEPLCFKKHSGIENFHA